MKKRFQARRGVTTVLVAISLVAILAAVALAIDAGRMVDLRRHTKAAADAAARAAAVEMLDLRGGTNPDATESTIRSSALDVAAANGYPNDGIQTIVTVNIPPKQGEYVARDGYVEVIIESRLQRGFSRIIGSDPVSVAARSVAVGTFVPSQGSVVVLDPKKKNALALGSGTSVLKVDGDVFVNSRHHKSPMSLKRSSQLEADNVSLAGDLGKKEFKAALQGIRGDLHTRAPPVSDPFAGLPIPEPGVNRKLADFKTVVDGVECYSLQPGHYSEDLKFDSNDRVTLAPGMYFLDGKTFELKGNASIEGSDVTIYSAGKAGMKFQSSGNVSLSPPTSGTYSGISLIKDPAARGKISFKKNADLDIQGTIYAPKSLVRFQKVDADLGDDDDESIWDDIDADLDDSLSGEEFASEGSLGGNIVAGLLKIDKHSRIVIRGASLRVLRPLLELVE